MADGTLYDFSFQWCHLSKSCVHVFTCKCHSVPLQCFRPLLWAYENFSCFFDVNKKTEKKKKSRSQRCTTLSFLDKGPSSNIIQPNKVSFIPILYLFARCKFIFQILLARKATLMLRAYWYVSIVHLYLSSSMSLWSISWSSPGVLPVSHIKASHIFHPGPATVQLAYIMPILECKFQQLFSALSTWSIQYLECHPMMIAVGPYHSFLRRITIVSTMIWNIRPWLWLKVC